MTKLVAQTILILAISLGNFASAEEGCLCELGLNSPKNETPDLVKAIMEPVTKITEAQVYSTLDEAVSAQKKLRAPKREFQTVDKKNFPSYSDCGKTFFRVVTVTSDRDKTITQEGWKSGYDRNEIGKALPPSADFSERIIQYVGVKGENKPFPRNSTIVGVMEDPVRTLSVGWHTGYTTDTDKYMRMDEIEIGSCSKTPECQEIKMADSSKVFDEDRKKREAEGKSIRTPRYSTEGEWAVDRSVPASCVKATYRVKYQKVDGINYSGSY